MDCVVEPKFSSWCLRFLVLRKIPLRKFHLQTLNCSKKTPWFTFCLVKPSVKGGKTDTIFVTSENFCLRLGIGHTVFFTSEKNRTTNHIACTLQRIILIWQLILE